MSDLVVGGMDTVGDVLVGRTGRGRRAVRLPGPKWAKNASMQGVSTPAEELDVLPFTPTTFINDNEVAILVPTAGQLVGKPQRPFRGERFLFTAVDATTGADRLDLINVQAPMFIGMVSIGSAFGQMPLRGFQATAFGVRLSLPAAGQGTEIIIPLIALTIPAFAHIIVSGMLFGRAVR